MKIYSNNSISDRDKSKLDKLAKTDSWILCHMNACKPKFVDDLWMRNPNFFNYRGKYFIKIVAIHDKYYVVYAIDFSDYKDKFYYVDSEEFDQMLSTPLYAYDIHIEYPVEVMTTDEMVEYFMKCNRIEE